MTNGTSETLLIIFVACTGAAVLMQAMVLLGMLIAMRKAIKMTQSQLDEFRTSVFPVVKDTHQLLTRVGPKVEAIVTDVSDLSHGLRAQGIQLQGSVTDIMERVRRQSSRVDLMLSGFLDTVDRAGAVVSEAVAVPLRQLAGVTAFLKAAFGTLRTRAPQEQQPTHSPADRDLFV